MNMIKWDNRFLRLAKEVASWSKDPSTKCGAVITDRNLLVSIGFNGFPKGVKDREEDYQNRELKYEKVLHGELNALLHANRSVKGCTIYVYPFMPCSRCMATIIQSGISRVVTLPTSEDLRSRWEDSHNIALSMAKEAGVSVMYRDHGENGL